MVTLPASLFLFAALVRPDGWELLPGSLYNNLEPITVPKLIRQVNNTGSSPMTISVEHKDYSKPQNITGSTSQDPPWTSKFTPLQTGTLTVGVTTGGDPTLGAGRWRRWTNIWLDEVGLQTWVLTGSNPLRTEARNRDWWTYTVLQITEGVIPPPPPGGGG